MMKPLPWFYAVNDRPVKCIATSEGGMDVLALDMKTGELKREIGMLSRVHQAGADVDELDEATFERKVSAIRERLAARR